MQRLQYLIHNGTLEIFTRLLMWKLLLFLKVIKLFNWENSSLLSCSRNAQFNLYRETTVKNVISFLNFKYWYLIQIGSEKAFKGNVSNRASSSLQRESLKLTLTVPLGKKGLNISYSLKWTSKHKILT